MTKKVSMQTIADNTGLSKSVVSRALAGKYGVSEHSKALVWAEAARLGYPLKVKNMLKLGNNTITVYMPRKSLTDTNYSVVVISGIESAINKLNMRMILVLVEPESQMPATRFDELPSVTETQGIIVFSQISERFLQQLHETGLPLVLVDFAFGGFQLPSEYRIDHVLANNYWGMYAATKYMIEKGHKRMIFVGSIDYAFSFLQRYHGCFDCVRKKKSVECRYIISAKDNYVTFNGREFDEVLDSDYSPDAIICANDVTAFEIYKKLAARSLRIPEDISVIGFDDVEKCTWIHPHLTTMSICKKELGDLAVSTLADRIQHCRPYNKEIYLDVELIERDSVRDR